LDSIAGYLISHYGGHHASGEKFDVPEKSDKSDKSEKNEKVPVSTPRA
jgi:hypothetical protein